MRTKISIENFLNERDHPLFQKYHMPNSELYNMKQFLIDNNDTHYDKSSGLYIVKNTVFNPGWNMSYLYAKDLDFTHCSLSGCQLVYGDYSYSAFSPGSLLQDQFLWETNFSYSRCKSTTFAAMNDRRITLINLSYCDLEEAVFDRIVLKNSSFIGSLLKNTQFIECELRENSRFDGSHFQSSNFTDCHIYSSSFQRSTLIDTAFIGCCIKGADGEEIDFSQSILDNIQFIQKHTENCTEYSYINLEGTKIKNSQLSDLNLANVKINSQFSIENSAVVDSRIQVGENQCVDSCRLPRYFNYHNIDYKNVKFSAPGYICWDESSGDGREPCKDSSLDARSWMMGLVGFGSAILLVLLIIAAVKIHRNYIRPYLNTRQLSRQAKWKTWPLTKALSDADIDAIHQIHELSGPNIHIPRDIYKHILGKRPGHTDEQYRNAKIEFGDPLPSYQAPMDNATAPGIRFFDTKDRIHFRRQQIDNTITRIATQACDPVDDTEQLLTESTSLLNGETHLLIQ